MPVSKAAMGRSYDVDHSLPPTSTGLLGNLLQEKRHEKTIALSTIILVAIAVVFGINAITQFER
jgi:hypothetical protein